jgi:hypothetical protein
MRTEIPPNVWAIASDLQAAASARNHAFVAIAIEKRKSINILHQKSACNTFPRERLYEQELTLDHHTLVKVI